MRKAISLTLILSSAYLCWQCATQTTPGGGPKDEQPPILERTFPKHKTKNFKDNTVQLVFDELIKLKDPKEEIIITPSPGKDVDIQVKAKALTIKPKNGWAPNTTYSISFRDAVQDITEGNISPNLYLAFSTGSTLDSLSISGSIKDALTERIPEKITVAIYSSDTFNIFKHTPLYLTKTNKTGAFKLDNIKPDKYFLYAFEDKNKNLKVDGQNEAFGFHPTQINLTKNQTKVIIPLVKVDTRIPKINRTRATGEIAFIKFNKNITDYKLTPLESTKPNNSFGDDQSEIKVYMAGQKKDSIRLQIQAQDSLGLKIDTIVYVKRSTNKQIEEKLKLTFDEPKLNTETGLFEFSVQASKLVKSINTDSVLLMLDSIQSITFKKSDFKIDTIFKKVSLKATIDKTKITKENKPNLITGVNFLTSIESDSVKRTKRPVTLLTLEETGTLSVEIKTETKEDFIIQLLSDNRIFQSISNQKKYTFKFLPATTYKIRVLVDKNKNGKWDPGNIYEKQPPEQLIYFINTDKKTDFPIRANWEVGPYSITF